MPPNTPEFCSVGYWEEPNSGSWFAQNVTLVRPGWRKIEDGEVYDGAGQYLCALRSHRSMAWGPWEVPSSVTREWARAATWLVARNMYRQYGIDVILIRKIVEPLDAPLEPGDSEDDQ